MEMYSGLEGSSWKIKLQNRVTQNDVTLRVTITRSRKIKSFTLSLELETKSKKFHLELLTRSRKVKSFTSSY